MVLSFKGYRKKHFFSLRLLKTIVIDVFRVLVACNVVKTQFLNFLIFLKVLYTNRNPEILENPEIQNFRIDFRENTKFALVDEFHRNQCQNEADSLYFQGKT